MRMSVRSFRYSCVLLALLVSSSHAHAQSQSVGTASPVSSAPSETSLPPVEDTDQSGNRNSRAGSAEVNNQMPQFQTSVQEATDAGLVPTLGTLGGNESITETASGFVPTAPGLTSLGGQAASAATSTKKLISLYATQSIAYTDNPGQLSGGQTSLSNQASALNQPDFYEVTSGGVLISKQLGVQTLFASANFSDTNYFHDKNFNTTRYNLSAGVDYAVGDECAGAVVVNQSQSAVPVELSAVSLSAQSSQNSSAEISSRCKVTGYLYTTSDFRLSSTSFTDPISSANDSMQTFGSGGLEYSVPGFVTMGLLSSIQDTQFSNRGALGAGLSDRTSQISFSGYVNKPVSRKLNVSLSAGIVDLATGSPTLSGSIEPIYTATVSYTYSPKTSFNVSYSKLVGSPQSVVSNFQQIESESLGANYRFSPKVSFGATVSRSTSSAPGGTSSALNETAVNTGIGTLTNFQTLTEQVNGRYTLATNASAVLSYQHVDRTQGSFGESKANIISLSVNYRR